ncbi:hypothetical protein TSAR_012700, partial [Trichomalopsis sarcophagae]
GSVGSLTNLKLSISVTSGHKFKPTAAIRQNYQEPHALDNQGCSITTAAGPQRQDAQDNKVLEKS